MSLSTNVQNLATRVGTEIKTIKSSLGPNSSLTTTQKSSLVAAINELNAAVKAQANPTSINDATAATTTTYSSQKIDTQIQAAINNLIGGAPSALDTLKELAEALSGKGDAAAVTNSLALKADKSDVGDTTVSYVTTFESALA